MRVNVPYGTKHIGHVSSGTTLPDGVFPVVVAPVVVGGDEVVVVAVAVALLVGSYIFVTRSSCTG